MTKALAGDEAWRLMAAQYPPLAEKSPPLDNSVDISSGPFDIDHLDAADGEPSFQHSPRGADTDSDIETLLESVGDRQPPDLVRDVLWSYENLENRRAKPQDAPTLGAWSLLLWARQYRNRFFEMVLPKAMTNRLQEDEVNQREETMAIEDVERVLGELMAAGEAELPADP